MIPLKDNILNQKELKMSAYVNDLAQILALSPSEVGRNLIKTYTGDIYDFSQHVVLQEAVIKSLTTQPPPIMGDIYKKIFRNGWLSPQGEWVEVDYGRHEDKVSEATGFSNGTDAREAQWIKFTIGNPKGKDDELIFSRSANREKITPEQVSWLNEWLDEIAGPKGKRPHF